MEIMKKIAAKAKNIRDTGCVTIAFLGDSVTQGCFEIYKDENQAIVPVFDQKNAYHAYLGQILSMLYPGVPVNMLNAGISGDTAAGGLERLERDVLRHAPDLAVVCYGLNDSGGGMAGVHEYGNTLREIFTALDSHGIERIFLTPNMMNTRVSALLRDDDVRHVAEETLKLQLNGTFDAYIAEAKAVCRDCGVKVCDCYEKWKLLQKNGVDITDLLSNQINHPTRRMNWLFAVSLLETMMQDASATG